MGQLTTTGATPAPRLFVAGTFDTSRRQLIVGGGGNETAFFEPDYFGDLYALDMATGAWEQVANAVGGPEPRFWGKLAYDPEFDSYLLFAGHDGTNLGNRNDLWEWRAAEGAWSLLKIGDTFQTPANGPNDFPDFALVDTSMPERRSAHFRLVRDLRPRDRVRRKDRLRRGQRRLARAGWRLRRGGRGDQRRGLSPLPPQPRQLREPVLPERARPA